MLPMRIALVVNAGSGGGTDGAALQAELEAEGADVVRHPFEAIQEVSLDGFDRLVVASGDGGVGLGAARASAAGVSFAVIPSGTANDFAGFLDLPEDPLEACMLAASPDARLRTLDVPWSGTIPFLNAAACGLSVVASERAEPLKKAIGALAYGVGAVQAAASEVAGTYRVLIDGEEAFDGDAWQIIVSGTGAFGNGSLVEEADPSDGELDVTILGGGPRMALALRAWGLKRGGLAGQEGVTHLRGREVVVEGADEWNVDGERCRHDDAGRFRLDGRVSVVVP